MTDLCRICGAKVWASGLCPVCGWLKGLAPRERLAAAESQWSTARAEARAVASGDDTTLAIKEGYAEYWRLRVAAIREGRFD